MFSGEFFRYEYADLEKNESFMSPDPVTTKNLKPNANYSKLENGFIRVGSTVEYGDVLIGRVEGVLGVDLRSRVEVCEVATPVTYARLTGNRDGAIMGFKPTPRNLRTGVARRNTPVRNVLIGGQWAEVGGGLP
jgi:hypothetical protein